MAESLRRVIHGIEVFEKGLADRPWIAGASYSLADINAFCMAYALPMMQAEHCNEQKTPRILDWLRRVYARPAILESFKLGRTPLAARALEVIDKLGGR